MKKLLLVFIIALPVIACKSTKVATPNASARPASDTALQGDSMKAPVKP